jgi:nitrogen-specific signal transduction histidine kinase
MHSLAGNPRWFATTLSLEGVITSLSPGAEQSIGYCAQELVGNPITRILDDSSVPDMLQILDAANQWGYWEGAIVHRTREGKSLEGRGRLSLLTGSENKAAGYLLFSNLSTTTVSSPWADSAISGVGEKLRVFAHELNNPLAIVMGFAQLLLVNDDCQGTLRMDVEKLYAELKRLTQVIDRLHQYAFSLQKKPKCAANSHISEKGTHPARRKQGTP